MLALDHTAMRLDVIIDVEPNFDFASAEYRALHNLRRATAFQSPDWLDAIHRELVPRLSGRQRTITIRSRDDGRLLAVLPLVVQRIGLLWVMQPADFGVCDANAVVADPQLLECLSRDPAVGRRLTALLKGADVLFFRKVRRDGFDVRRLFSGAVASRCENAAYHCDTGEDLEIWRRKTLNRKLTRELERLGRQIERAFGPYEHRLAKSEEDIRAAFAHLRNFREGRFELDLLDHPAYADFYLQFALAGAARGDALTYVSYLAGEPVAVLFGVGCEDECHAVLLGADTARFAKYSLGMQILYRTIGLRYDEGSRRLDFGLGNTGYKSMFRVEETLLDNVTVSCSLVGAAAAFVYHRSKPLKNTLRRLTPRLR